MIQNSLTSRSAIKNWCVTVWSGVLVLGIAQKITESFIFILILVGGTIFFWLADAVERTREQFYRNQIIEIEEGIVSGKDTISSAGELFALSVYKKNTWRKKLKEFVKSCITSETIISFYPILIVVSLTSRHQRVFLRPVGGYHADSPNFDIPHREADHAPAPLLRAH